MADFTRGSVTDAIAHQHVTHAAEGASALVVGADQTITDGAMWAKIELFHGFTEAAANTNPGSFYIQTSLEASGVEDAWLIDAQFLIAEVGTPADEALDAQEVAGTAAIAVTFTAGFVADDLIYITDSTADNNSEWHQISHIVTDTTVNLVDDLDFQKEIGDVIFGSAEHFRHTLDLSGIAKWRVIFKHQGAAGANVAIRARYIEVTDFA